MYGSWRGAFIIRGLQPPTKRWRKCLVLGRIWTPDLWNIGHSIHGGVTLTIRECIGTHEEATWASCPWQNSNPWPMEFRSPHTVESPPLWTVHDSPQLGGGTLPWGGNTFHCWGIELVFSRKTLWRLLPEELISPQQYFKF